jgi:site-specific DNA-methyltransferase (adenine-specific)
MGYGDDDGHEEIEAWNCAPGCAVATLDAQSGLTGAKAAVTGMEPSSDGFGNRVYDSMKRRCPAVLRDELGSASRFFPVFEDDASFRYVRRPSPTERNTGCYDFLWRRVGRFWERVDQETWDGLPDENRAQGNVHPTLKPVALLRWLVRLVCPEKGTVLDPFLGSGSTAVACLQEDFSCVGVEQDAENYAIARARVEWTAGSPVSEHGDILPPRPEKLQGELFT